MTTTIPGDGNLGPWMVDGLSGLSVTLEATMLLQALLRELQDRYETFHEACPTWSDEQLYSEADRASLRRAIDRLSALRNETLQFHSDLGRALVWGGTICDDRQAFSQRALKNLGLPKTFVLCGFDRANMIEKGKVFLALLRRSRGAIAAVHIAAENLYESVHWVKNDSDSPPLSDEEAEYDSDAPPLSDDEKEQHEALEDLVYWVSNDVDRIRALLRNYTIAVEALQRAENAKVNAAP